MKRKFNLAQLLSIPEVILILLYFIGIVCKIMHLPFANLLLTFVLLTLAGVHMMLGIFTIGNVDPRELKVGIKTDTLLISKLFFGFVYGVILSGYVVAMWGLLLKLPWALLAGRSMLILAIITTVIILIFSIKKPAILWVFGRFLLSVGGLLIPAFIFN